MQDPPSVKDSISGCLALNPEPLKVCSREASFGVMGTGDHHITILAADVLLLVPSSSKLEQGLHNIPHISSAKLLMVSNLQ